VPLDGCHVTDVYGLVNIGVWLSEESLAKSFSAA
jgi:hypothetical protein